LIQISRNVFFNHENTKVEIHKGIDLMETNQRLRKQLGDLFHSQNLAVLSTQHAGQPYASLVAFYAADDLKHIYFVTPKATRKYANLVSDSRVAILVNSSTNQTSDFHQAVSVTAVGRAADVTGGDKNPILVQYLARHPHLEDFARSPTCALVGVTVDSYYMVQNFQNVTELHLTS
jgi:nitroimidazol reductase NimA-like FMN-containing flavoprotein (pyridoxamine 5'-phosphate oxidase superfamily)